MRSSRGFSMVEVLVSLVIVAVGLLGLAALQSRAQQVETESYQRAQALVIVEDMLNRVTANRPAAGCYAITDSDTGLPYIGKGNTTNYNCAGFGTIATQAVANADLADLDSLLKGSAESVGGSDVGAMLNARGCISHDDVNDTYTVAVAWESLRDIAIDPDSTRNPCASGTYSSEARRRVVEATFQIADLG